MGMDARAKRQINDLAISVSQRMKTIQNVCLLCLIVMCTRRCRSRQVEN